MSSPPPSQYSSPSDPPWPGYSPYPAPSGLQGTPPSKTLAGWSLGLAIFPNCLTWILAVVFSCIVISRSKDGRDHGKGMSIAALIIVVAWVVVTIGVVALIAATSADRDQSGRVTEGGRASVFDLRAGDCLPQGVETGTQRTAELVECAKPHRGEVFATFGLDGQYTNDDDVRRLSAAGCIDRFQDFMGVPADKSAIKVFYIRPLNPVTFARDPGVSCIAVSETDVTGSMKGAKR